MKCSIKNIKFQAKTREQKSARSLSDVFSWTSVWDLHAEMLVFFFFQALEGLTEVFGRMSAGISGPKLPLGADFSFLKNV